ncbi:MAG: hypothetical protein HY332_09395 [Chloroflexi bacterium]|nr:hypothetical protein [Chloroflexota bacterium]
MLALDPGVSGREAPGDGCAPGVAPRFPGADLLPDDGGIVEASIEALSGKLPRHSCGKMGRHVGGSM